MFSTNKKVNKLSTNYADQSIDEYKVYPLVFIKTDQGFRLPVDLDYGQKSDTMQSHKRKFKTSGNESEVFFCPAAIPLNKKEKKRNTDGLLKRTPSINHEVSQVCIVAKSENQDRKTIDVKCDPESEPVIWESSDKIEQNSEKGQSKIEKYTFGYKVCILIFLGAYFAENPNSQMIFLDRFALKIHQNMQRLQFPKQK